MSKLPLFPSASVTYKSTMPPMSNCAASTICSSYVTVVFENPTGINSSANTEDTYFPSAVATVPASMPVPVSSLAFSLIFAVSSPSTITVAVTI